MGSKASRRLASAATSSSVRASPGSTAPFAGAATSFPAMTRWRTVIRFWVSVPVLSTHKTVAAPSVSIAGILRVSTRLREILQAPSARKTVSTTGSSSGRIDIAMAMPARKPSFQTTTPPPRKRA